MITSRFVRLLLAGVLTLLLLVSAGSAQAATKEVWRYNFSGETATAYYFASDACVQTWLDLFYVVNGREHMQRKPVTIWVVAGFIYQYDFCADTAQSGYFYSELEPDAFQVQRDLSAATLRATLLACDDECFSVEVDLAWTGVGDTFRNKGVSHFTSPDYRSVYRYDSTARFAESAGSVTTAFGATYLQAYDAQLQSVKSGSVVMYRVE
jgi:hypothetical protein